MRTSFPVSPRLRRTAAVLALALVATGLAHRPASSTSPATAGRRPWLAVVASIAPLPRATQEFVRVSFRTIGVQGTGSVRLEIEDARGQAVRTIDAKVGVDLREGILRWDGRDSDGRRVGNGLYEAHLVATDSWGVERSSAVPAQD
ncbi:MAG: FlgD immunoglobulin-like domain containing protein, partial [Actinomycetota bacterium]